MKIKLVQLSLIILISACSKGSIEHHSAPPHIPIDATHEEYERLLAKIDNNIVNDPPIVTKGLKWGKRLNNWVSLINNSSQKSAMIRLSSPNVQKGISIDEPSYLSIEIMEALAHKISQNLPASILSYLDGGEIPGHLELVDAELLKKLRNVITLYEASARFKLMIPYLDFYKQEKERDIRSYYFFVKKKWTIESFDNFSFLTILEQKEVNKQIQKLCELRWDVSEGENRKERCLKLLTEARFNNSLPEEWELSMRYGKVLWDSFFKINDEQKTYRKDINHTDENLLIIPFKRPSTKLLADFLKVNVENEFSFENWKLEIQFTEEALGKLVFQSGVTPHVNALAGDQIIMDENMEIEEFDSMWTIRHEFGHVLGLPDCYLEFYDEELKAFVNYQLDVDDLMCSRKGKMNARIKNELQRVYHKSLISD